MRINDLITEQEQQLDEFLGKALGALFRWLNPASKQAAEQLTAVWAKEIAKHGAPKTAASKIVGKAMAKDPKVVQTAAKEAEKLANKAAIKAGVQVGKNAVQTGLNITDSGLKWLVRWQAIGSPIFEYNQKMKKWEQALANNEITQEEYEGIREKELSFLVGRVASGIAVSGVIRGTLLPMIAGFKAFGNPMMSSILSGVSRAGTAYMLSWMNSDEGREILANIMVNGFVDPIVGGTTANLIDKVRGKAREANGQQPAADGKPQQDDEKSTPAGDLTPADKANTSNISGKDSQPDRKAPGDENLPPNLERDPATGKLRIKVS